MVDEILKDVLDQDPNADHLIEPQEGGSDEIGLQADANDELKKLREDNESLKDRALRIQAEMENLRRRFDREREDNHRFATSNVLRDFLSISDDLERALSVALQHYQEESQSAKVFIEGVQMIEKSLVSIFERHHVKKIAPQGENFNPNFHQAMVEIETADQAPGTIVQVLQTGYSLHERLLRPALVGVAKASA